MLTDRQKSSNKRESKRLRRNSSKRKRRKVKSRLKDYRNKLSAKRKNANDYKRSKKETNKPVSATNNKRDVKLKKTCIVSSVRTKSVNKERCRNGVEDSKRRTNERWRNVVVMRCNT